MQGSAQSTAAESGLQVRVKTSRDYRALTHLMNGQQIAMWLPAGWYSFGSCVDIRASDLGNVDWMKARVLVGQSQQNRGTWYVAENVAAEMAVQGGAA